MASNIRRSGRQRQVNKKYQNDLLEKEALRLLRESSESSRPTSPDDSDPEEVDSDNEFDTAKLEEAQISEDNDENLSLMSGTGRGMSEGSDIQTPEESDENMSIATSGISQPEDYEGRAKGPGLRGAQRVSADAHSRGLAPTPRHAGRQLIWESLAGPSDEDVLAFLLVRDYWRWRRDVTFPSRKSLAEIARQGIYGNVSRFGVLVDDLRHEAVTGWKWYEEELGDRFKKRQRLDSINDQQAQKHIVSPDKHVSKIVIGPTDNQRAYHIPHLASLDFGVAWEELPKPVQKPGSFADTGMLQDDTSNNIHPRPPAPASSSRYREGWLLNIGNKIQCLSWASNRHGTDTQYLAISTPCTPSQRDSVPASNDRRAPAFRPSPPYPSSIQIWAFRSKSDDEGLQKPDMTSRPKLIQLLCTDWGNIRQLQWCPVLREPSASFNRSANQSDSTNLGLLAMVTSDGHARVLDISVPKLTENEPQYLHVKSAAFDAISSSSLYTCLSFVSPTDLLCGTASGLVDLYNILQPNNNAPNLSASPSSSPTPYLTTHESHTYLLTLSPAYPSSFPHLLASTSMSGTPILTSLLSPTIDTVPGKSARNTNKNLVYSPHLRSYIFTSESDDIQAYPIRRFFNGVRLVRFTGQGGLTALAASRWHPCLLVGTSSGTVSCTNMIRRVLPSMKRGSGTGAWVQKLCEYQWIPDRPSPAATGEADVDNTTTANVDSPIPNSGQTSQSATQPTPTKLPSPNLHQTDPQFHTPPTRQGTSRLHESFLATRQDLSALAKMKARGPDAIAQKIGSETIYEEEQAVTAMEWNPNLQCAGWVAVGWGSGVLRVEDCGHEGV